MAAAQRITDLAAYTTPAATDVLVVVDISDTTMAATGTDKQATPTQVLDAIGAVQGDIMFRGASAWTALAPGTSGQVLATQGAAANPHWVAAAGSGTVTSIVASTGLSGGTITSTGTIALAAIANHDLLANTSGGSAVPIATTLTALIDDAIDNTQGDILYRSATAWSALAPGTSGQILASQGASANPHWITASGSGTVTSVAVTVPANMAVSGSPVTTSGTLAITSTTPAVSIFSSSGTYTMPVGATFIRAIGLGGGAGGGGGGTAASGTAIFGGGGGAGGGKFDATFRASDITSPVTVTIGAGGAGGAGGGTGGATGTTGTAGGITSFGTYAATNGAGGGVGGSTASGNSGAAGHGTFAGGGGGASSTSATAGVGVSSFGGAPGGGAGGGTDATPTARAGGAGGQANDQTIVSGGAGGSTGGGNGTAGTAAAVTNACGCGSGGGGAGASNTSATSGGTGGAGTTYGSGGGGGGAALSAGTATGGAGGAGGGGFVIVVAW